MIDTISGNDFFSKVCTHLESEVNIIAIFSLIVSIISASIAWRQARKADKALKANLFTTIIDDIHQNSEFQKLLGYVFQHALKTKKDPYTKKTKILYYDQDITNDIDRLLSRLQVLGHLIYLKVINIKNLQPIRSEILSLGRDQAIQEYFHYLNTIFIKQSDVIHDHFQFFKKLYMKFEKDKGKRSKFKECLFKKEK